MSRAIDEKVVEMSFNNKDFESGVKESLNTLDKLKKSLDLDESAKNFAKLDKAANSVSLAGITAGIEALQDRFSTLGIVSMRIIENITDSLMKMASSAVSYINDAIVGGGFKRAQNIENAHFQLQALLKDEIQVQAVMDNAMASVSGTAYAYDEAAKAASQFAASGLRAGEEMESALRGITGVASMTNSEYESISRIFTTVAGNGRLMGDQLLQLSSRGLNAAATLVDYYQNVLNFTDMTEAQIRDMVSHGEIDFRTFAAAMDWAFGESAFRANETFTGSLANMRAALAKIGAEFFSPLIEQNSDLILLINTFRERINDVKSALTFDEQKSAISGLAKATGLTTETFDELFGTIKERGSVASVDLLELSNVGVDASKKLTDYINGVTSGTIRTTYATKTALNELTEGLEVSEEQVRQFVEEGKIDINTFTSAMETAYGDQIALSKMFSESVLDIAKNVSSYLQTLDLSKPLSLVYYGVDSVKNVFSGLLSVLKPVANAFSQVFLSFSVDDVIALADRIENLTAKMKLSEKGSQDLHDAFYGVFSVVKAVIDAFFDLIAAVIPVGKPIGTLADLSLSLAGAMGRGLTSLTDWIRNLPELRKVYNLLASGIRIASSAITEFITHFDDFIDYIYNLPIVQKIVQSVTNTFQELSSHGSEYLSNIVQKLKTLRETLTDAIPNKAKEFFDNFSETIKTFGGNLKNVQINSVLDVVRNLFSYLQNLDLSKPLSLGLEVIENKIVRLYSIVKPITNAFLDVFSSLDIGIEDVIELVSKLKNLTKAFTLTEKRSKDLYDAFHGVFSIITLLSGVFVGLVDLANLLLDPLIDIVFSLAGALGRALTAFTEWVRTSPKAKQAFTAIGDGIRSAMVWLSNFIENMGDFVYYIRELPIVKSVINGVTDTFRNLYTNGSETFAGLIQKIKEFREKVTGLIPDSILGFFDSFGQKIKDVGNILGDLRLTGITDFFHDLAEKIRELLNVFKGNEGLDSFIANIKQYFSNLTNAFTFDKLVEKIETFKTFIGNFLTWIRDTIGPLFENFSLGGAAATAGGFGIIYAVIELSRTFGKFFKDINAIPSTLGSIRATLTAYQKDIKADAIVKIAEAIGILALAITVLSFADMEQAYAAAALLAQIGTILVLAVGYFSNAFATLSGMNANVYTVINTLAKSLNQLTKAVKWKVIGTAVKNMAIAVGIIVASIVALAYAYSKDSDGLLDAALIRVGIIVGVIVGIVALMSLVGKKLTAGMVSFGVASFGVLALSAALVIIISAIKKLFEIEFPDDWEDKMHILGDLFLALGLLAATIALTTKNAKKGGSIATSLIAFSAALYISVMAVQKLFGIELPIDYKKKLDVLIDILGGLALVILALGFASALSQGKLKAVGTLLSLCLVIGTIVGALAVLTLFPGEKLKDRASTLGVTLIALAIALVAAGAITSKNTWKTVVSMALAIGSITVALGVLSLIRGDDLLKAALALGGVLACVAIVLYATSKITDKLSITSILIMLAELAGITAALYILADKPWQSLLAAAVSLGTVLIAIAAAMQIMSNTKVNLGQIGSFLTGLVAVLVVSLALSLIADKPWESLLAAAASISLVLEAIALAMVICSGVGATAPAAIAGIGLFDIFVGNLALVLYALGHLSEEAEAFLNHGGEILVMLGKYLGEFVGSIVGGILEGVTNSLPTVGQNLTDFANNASGFFSIVGGIKAEAVSGAGRMVAVIALMTAADLLTSIENLISLLLGGMSFAEVGTTLSSFATESSGFFSAVTGIGSDAVTGAKNLLEIILLMTAADLLTGITNFLSVLLGSSSLTDFAGQLKSLGEGISGFADEVSGINSETLTSATNAAKVLVELQNGLENTGGLVSFFTGDNDLESFGKQLKKFGKGIADFDDSVSDVNAIHLGQVIDKVEKIVGVVDGLSGLDTSGMTGFSDALKTMGENGINEFIQAFDNAVSDVQTAIQSMMSSAETQVTTSGALVETEAESVGESITTSLQSGIVNKQTEPLLSITTLCTALITQTKVSLPSSTFVSLGQGLMVALSSGITGSKLLVTASARTISQSVLQAFRENLSQNAFREIGAYAAEGLSLGISSKVNSIKNSTVAAAKAAINAAKSTLDVHSPSRVFYKIGEFIPIGLANGILDTSSLVSSASSGLSDYAINPVRTAIEKLSDLINDGDIDYEPVIRPVMDLSTVEEGLDSISSMFNRLNVGATASLADLASLGFNTRIAKTTKETATDRMEDKLDQLLNDEERTPNVEYHNTFNIQSTDPKEAAEEIGYIMQHKVERGRAVWER